MKIIRKLLLAPALFLFSCLILAACFSRGDTDNSAILNCLGKTDTQIVEDKGTGNAQTYQRNGSTFIISRGFKESIFGLSCNTEYMYADNQTVSQIITEFDESSSDTVLAAVTSSLGDPATIQKQTADTQFKAVWQKESFTYTLIRQPASKLYMIIE